MASVVGAGLRASGAGGCWEGKCKQRKKILECIWKTLLQEWEFHQVGGWGEGRCWKSAPDGEKRIIRNEGKCTSSTLEDALLLVWSVTCVAVSLNPSVLSASLLGGSTSDVPGGGHAGICHQQGVQEQGPRKNWDSNRSWLAGVMSLATSYSLPEWVIMACCSFATAESGRIKSFANMADEALGFLEKRYSVLQLEKLRLLPTSSSSTSVPRGDNR